MKERIPLAQAEKIAESIIEMLRSSTERISIAGSIRRKRPDIGDVEIVAIARTEPSGLFGDGPPVDQLTALCDSLLASGRMAHRLDKNDHKSYGPKFKRLLFDGFPLDLFATTRDQFGLIFMIRTGPAEFSHRLVSPKPWGFMPEGLCVQDGWLRATMTTNGNAVISCPEEINVFNALGIKYISPEQRT